VFFNPKTQYSKEVLVMSNDKQERSRKGASGLVFVGCLILGIALGFLIGNMAGGFFVGLGVGFIAMAIVRAITGEW
jgi:predicted lipid-binding transport protein (Tim44 family)